ncbi:MAG: winged helix-turn-helix transcriptional regulator [Candidatus Lokiarchaeota archaeon]|nr:winged helix-turn-helix transcriptional regulator [Candidatus Lokiarchaeota archaeon]
MYLNDHELDCLFTMKGKMMIFIRENRYREPPVVSEDIQEKFKISKSTASEHLSDLEKRKLIYRKRVGKHKYIFPTDFGKFFL